MQYVSVSLFDSAPNTVLPQGRVLVCLHLLRDVHFLDLNLPSVGALCLDRARSVPATIDEILHRTFAGLAAAAVLRVSFLPHHPHIVARNCVRTAIADLRQPIDVFVLCPAASYP